MSLFLRILMLVTFLSGCGSNKQNAPAPLLEPADTPAELPVSTLQFPIVIPYADVEKRLNKELGIRLYEDNDFENNGVDNIKLTVHRTGNIRMNALNDYLQFTVPLNIWVEGRIKSSLGGIFSPQQAPQITKAANFKIEVTLSSKAEAQSDWSIKTTSQVNFRWTASPTLDFGIVKLPIGGLIEKVVAGQLNKLAVQLDAEAKKQLQFRTQVDQYWREIQQPIRIAGPFPAILYIQPESIQLAPLKPGPASLELRTAIQAKILLTTDTLLRKPALIPMPALRLGEPATTGAQLMLTAALSYSQLSELARKNIAGQEFAFENGKHRLTLEDIEISGLGTTLQAKVRIKGSAKAGLFGRKKLDGTYYFTGTPYYEPIKQEIRIKNFDFDVKSKDLLLQTAEWLFKSNFKKQLAEQLRYPLAKDLQQLSITAENALNKPFSKEILLSGKITKLEPGEIRLDPRQLVIYVETTGTVAIQFKD